jgi:hypothetical protein
VAPDVPSAGIENDRIAFGQSHYDPCDGPSCLLQKTKKIRAVGPRRTPTVMTACATSFSLSTGGHIAIALRAGPLGHADSGPRGAAQPPECSIPERSSVRTTARRRFALNSGPLTGLGGDGGASLLPLLPPVHDHHQAKQESRMDGRCAEHYFSQSTHVAHRVCEPAVAMDPKNHLEHYAGIVACQND